MKRHLRQTPRRKPAQRGFTLIELLVTISIIALIAGLAIPVISNGLRSAAESQTNTLLGQLAGSATEYREQVGEHVTFSIDAATYDDDVTADAESINRYVSAVRDNSQLALDQLRTVDADLFNGGVLDEDAAASASNGPVSQTTISDRFGNPIRYFPGSDNLNPGQANQAAEGLVRKKQPYFASAGQDGVWGTISAATNEPNDDGAADNLYSFEVK